MYAFLLQISLTLGQALIPKLGKVNNTIRALQKDQYFVVCKKQIRRKWNKKLLGEAKRLNLRKLEKLREVSVQGCWVTILNSFLILQPVMPHSQFCSSSENPSHQKGQSIAFQGCLLVSCQMNQSFCSEKHYQVIWGAAAPNTASLVTFLSLLHRSVLILLVVSACYILEELK